MKTTIHTSGGTPPEPQSDTVRHTAEARSNGDSSADVIVEVRGLGVSYGSGSSAVMAIEDVSMSVRRGEFVCVVGPSGCGKTTLLKAMSGLMQPSRGTTAVSGAVVKGPPRDLALVFQDYTRSLLPWLTVEGNVSFPLTAAGVPRVELRDRVHGALTEVGLGEFGAKYPWQLSGGMQQRVAIARAIAYRAPVLLMDEPFASVDAQTRAELEDLMLRVQNDLGVTVILVTHDIDESVYMANRVVVLSKRPTHVQTEIDVDLPYPRDQLSTKADPQFIALRTEILRLIMAQRDT